MRTMLFILGLVGFALFTFSCRGADNRIKIGIVDSGIRNSTETLPFICNGNEEDFTGTGIYDTIGHGTNVAGIITKDLDPTKYCIVVVKFFTDYNMPGNAMREYLLSLEFASKQHLDYLNLSLNGMFSNQREKELLQQIGKDTIIVTAAGNDGLDLSKTCFSFPACYGLAIPNMFVVSSTNSLLANIRGPVNTYQDGNNVCGFGICLSGTSQAAAVYTNKLLKLEPYFRGESIDEKFKKNGGTRSWSKSYSHK